MDYGFLISFIAAAKFTWNKKNFKILIDIFKGYWENYRTNQPKIVTAEEGRFIRNYRWKGIKINYYSNDNFLIIHYNIKKTPSLYD